ncbi:hypothetical protein N1031_17850 [Herbiconiux moechotypicola]|uniref:Uncharacterized protein n=1 Tax=Herbiconiux moechotypicola TaxID=637393 RepID=A0ABN3E3M3_9MICO|nr:hypothetical protein [Herbiconiux moechotypicola]MCS5731624.1 hypothetical protein [Herbiconiux moechotypicola]
MSHDDPLDTFTLKKRTTEQRLFNADDTLAAATHGLELLQPEPFIIDERLWIDEFRAGRFTDVPPMTRQTIGRRLYMGLRIASVFAVSTTLALQSLRSTEPSFDEWWAPRSAELAADPLAKFYWDMRVDLAHRGASVLYNIVSKHELTDRSDPDAIVYGSIYMAFYKAPLPDGRVDAYDLTAEYLEKLGALVSEAWAEFSPETQSTGIRSPLKEGVPELTITPDGGEPEVIQLVRPAEGEMSGGSAQEAPGPA